MREIKHLSVHQWLRSAIPDSQQPTSPIGFLFLKLPPPPCAVLLVYYAYYTNGHTHTDTGVWSFEPRKAYPDEKGSGNLDLVRREAPALEEALVGIVRCDGDMWWPSAGILTVWNIVMQFRSRDKFALLYQNWGAAASRAGWLFPEEEGFFIWNSGSSRILQGG